MDNLTVIFLHFEEKIMTKTQLNEIKLQSLSEAYNWYIWNTSFCTKYIATVLVVKICAN